MRRQYHFLFALLFLLPACKSVFIPSSAQYEQYRITGQLPKDSALLALMQPYRDSLSKSMNEVIGVIATSLEKKLPSGTLNNFMADAMLEMARQKIDANADVAFVNYGGIRLTQLPAGPLTRWKAFELMPFDNILVVQELKGTMLQDFLDLTAAKGGFAVAGLTMQIQSKKAVNVLINGKPLDPLKTYKVVNSDYIVNGGDDAGMLTNLPQKTTGYLMRDAIMDYVRMHAVAGKQVNAQNEKRVINAE
jgi:2',3'-cyclic-nucleotide 2'-phosphodiesterase (5'-nucleotidase family)